MIIVVLLLIVNKPTVQNYLRIWPLKLMHELESRSRMQKRSRKPKTIMSVDYRPNFIKNFHDLSGVLQTDITYIQLTINRWVYYLATVFYPEKRKSLGYKIDDTMTAEIATSVLQMVLDKHQRPLIVYSNMGHNTQVLNLISNVKVLV